jgi:UDP-glucose 4-epimerase
MKALVTGGAGFIGSHLIDYLLKQNLEVACFDNFSSGKKEFIKKNLSEITLFESDLKKNDDIIHALDGCDVVFHLAANPDVRTGAQDTQTHFDNNILATFNLLEGMRKKNVPTIVFTSSSTVYGDATIIPTTENYAPLIPISTYGASKLASEALIASYCHTFDMNSVIYRFANVVGPRSTHGVIFDFITKLMTNSKELDILGDGKQKKSYLYITDCIDAMWFGFKHSKDRVEIFNIGSEGWTEVTKIADIISQEMGVDPNYRFSGGSEGRGWKGDVKYMRLDIGKIKAFGWQPVYNSKDAVKMTVQCLIKKNS